MGIFNNIGRYHDIQDYIKNFNQQIQSGLKLDVNNNYDIEGKRLANVGQGLDDDDAVVMHQLTSLDSVLNMELLQLKADSLQVDGTSHMTGDLDLRGNKLILPGEINMNRKLIKNLDVNENDDLSAVNMVTLKKFSSSSSPSTSGDIDLQEKFNVKNSKQQSFQEMETNYDNLISYEDAKKAFLSKKETFPMETALDMGNQTIFNVKDPTVDDHGVNKGYVDKKFLPLSGGTMKNELSMGGNKITNIAKPTHPTDAATKFFVEKETQKCLSLGGGTMTGQIDMGGKKITNLATPTSNSDAATKKYLDDEVKKTKDGIIDSHSLKDEFRYLMEDVNESSSESNIEVDGISDLEKSPHKHNKKAYDLKLKKTSGENYASRLGFNMYKLPEGEYTICVEFFPVKMTNVSVNAVSSSLNIGQQTTTLFTQEGYARSIIHMHKWQISPPEYLMLDLHCEGKTPIGQAYLIIYGIKGKYSDVPKNVFDQPFVFETGKMGHGN